MLYKILQTGEIIRKNTKDSKMYKAQRRKSQNVDIKEKKI